MLGFVTLTPIYGLLVHKETCLRDEVSSLNFIINLNQHPWISELLVLYKENIE